MGRHVQARDRVISTAPEQLQDVARRLPAATAIVLGGRRLTYRDLEERAKLAARRLLTLGVSPGDRVAIVSENSPEYIVLAFAVWEVGGILATVYPSSGLTELEYVLQNAAPRLSFVDADRAALVRQAVASAGSGTRVLVLSDDRVADDVEPSSREMPIVDPAAACLICYTSGTTARPKPVLHSHLGILGAARTYASSWHFGPDDKVLVSLPIAWIYGLVTASLAALSRGGAVVLLPHFNPVAVLDVIEKESVTAFVGVTTMYVKLLGHARERAQRPDLSSLRFCVTGGEPRNEVAFAEWVRLTACPVHDVYASSECFPVVTYDPKEDPTPRHGSAGKVVPGATLSIRTADGVEVTSGEIGIGFSRGPGLMLGYWNEPELTQSALTPDGWYRTNDLIRIDEQGYVFVVGRASDMIIRGGSNVSPPEVEAVLAQHPAIAEAVVFGLPDEIYGQAVAAAVVLAHGATLDDEALRAFCRGKLAPYKVPSIFRALEDFPRNANGKAQRREVAELVRSSLLEGR